MTKKLEITRKLAEWILESGESGQPLAPNQVFQLRALLTQPDVSLTDEGNKPAPRRTDEVQFKGMIETGCGNFAVMIDKANAHYGWTFKRHPDGMWVSGRVATPAEMQAAIAHARFTTLQL